MFASQYRSWCIVTRMLKSNASVTRLIERAITFPVIKTGKSSSRLHNLAIIPNGASYEDKNQTPISKCLGLAGLLGVLGKDDEKEQPSGELKIIEMIKLAKLSQEVFWLTIKWYMSIY